MFDKRVRRSDDYRRSRYTGHCFFSFFEPLKKFHISRRFLKFEIGHKSKTEQRAK